MWTLIVIAGAVLAGFFLFNLAGRGGVGLGGGLGGLLGGGRKKCGYCRSWVRSSASHCPKCGYEFINF